MAKERPLLQKLLGYTDVKQHARIRKSKDGTVKAHVVKAHERRVATKKK